MKLRHEDRPDNDLVYITPRVLVTSNQQEPETLESLLTAKHEGKYKIFNFCADHQEHKRLRHDRIFSSYELEHIPMDDKIPGSMLRLEEIVARIDQYLHTDLCNVVVLYCETGFEKCGFICICYLLFHRVYTETKDAINYFAEQRLSIPGEFYNLMPSDYLR